MIYWRTDIAGVIIQTFFPYILTLYYIKQIDSKLPCVCSLIDHRGCQNVIRTSVAHLAAPRVPLMFLSHFDILCDLLLNRHMATWNLFVRYTYEYCKNWKHVSLQIWFKSKCHPLALSPGWNSVCGFEFSSTSLLMARWTVSLEWEC